MTVSFDGRWTDVPGFDPTLPCLLDRKGWASSIGVDRVPTTVVIDPSGRVRWVKSGVARTEDLVREARTAMEASSFGAVTLQFGNFPPENGGWALLDQLRRLGVHATFILRGSYPKRLEPEVSEAKRLGHLVLPKALSLGRFVDAFDETRPGLNEIIRRVSQQAQPNSTIVLHADVEETHRVLPALVAALRRAGLDVR